MISYSSSVVICHWVRKTILSSQELRLEIIAKPAWMLIVNDTTVYFHMSQVLRKRGPILTVSRV